VDNILEDPGGLNEIIRICLSGKGRQKREHYNDGI
jgi:hypothetical protein